MSGSLKEVVRALGGILSSPAPSYPLADDVQEVIRLYLDRYEDIDDQDSQRLQDELLNLYHKFVAHDSGKQPAFLAALRHLRLAIRGEDRLLEWWKLLLRPTFDRLGHDSTVAAAARELLLSVLVYDDDDDLDGELAQVSELFAQEVLDVYLEKTSIPGVDHEGDFAVDDHARLIGNHLESVLVDFGRKKPKNLLIAIDTLLEIKEHRRQALSLLCTFVRFQPPHLHQVVRTPLIDHLLQCLMIDTSTTVISLALLSLVMFLPHIPGAMVPYLPRLFIVYSRLLCWDRYYGPRDETETIPESPDEVDSDEQPSSTWSYSDPSWDKLGSSFNVADATIRDLTPYFSFLYGLYPENFLGFIRKPNRYLRNARFPGLERLDLDQDAIRLLTERYRRMHLIHPNFYNTTVEAELSDLTRFVQCEPSDIVALCMELCVAPPPPPAPPPGIPRSVPLGELALPSEAFVATEDIPRHLDLSGAGGTSAPDGRPLDQQSITSAARDLESVAESFGLRKESHLGSSRTSNDFAMTRPAAQDSPTLPSAVPQPRQRESEVREMLQTQELLRSMFRVSQAGGEEGDTPGRRSPSQAPSSPRLSAYVHSLANMPDRSPAIQPVSSDARRVIVLLQREVLLLRNDLNFERFLKQQHLSHIGQLQRKYIQDATTEADTQNLIHTNRALKVKADEARRAYSTLKKETAAGRNHAKKWETEVTGKSRVLRDHQRRWEAEEQRLRRDLDEARKVADRLRTLLMESEARELTARQQLEAMQATVKELEKLRSEVETMDERLRAYERREEEFEHAQRSEEMTFTQLETARLRLQARDAERDRMHKAYEERIAELDARLRVAQNSTPTQSAPAMQAMIDSALSSSRARFDQLKKVYNRLLTRHAELEIAFMDLQAAAELGGSSIGRRALPTGHLAGVDIDGFGDESNGVGGGGGGNVGGLGHDLNSRELASRRATAASRPGYSGIDPSLSGFEDYGQGPGSSQRSPQPQQFMYTSNSAPPHVGQMDSMYRQTGGGLGLYDPGISRSEPHHHLMEPPSSASTANKKGSSSEEFGHSGESARGSSRSDSVATETNNKRKQRIKPNSGARVYGRGGVQNIGKKENGQKGGKNGDKGDKQSGFVKNGVSRIGFRGLSQSS